MQTATTTKLMQDLRTVVGDAEELLKATAGQSGERIDEVRARAEESVRAARTRLEAAARDVNEQVHENPWTAIGVAAGVGLVLGIVLARK
jgi:ElaB/YqjD/DUF883 family membrane-anchored ribosome-binding protein